MGDTKVWSSGLSKAVSYTKNTNPIAWDTGTYLRSIKVNNLKDSRNLILTQSATLSSSGATPKVYEFNIDTLSVRLNASNLSSLYTHTIEAVQLNVVGTWYVVGTIGDYIRFFQGSTQKNQTYDSSIKEFKPIMAGDRSEYMFGNSVFYMCDSGGTGGPPMHKLTLE